MTSTCSSNEILTVDSVSVSYEVNSYKQGADSFRDLFIGACKAPYEFIFKKKDRVNVIDNVSFKVFKGDRLGIIGVNGVGKTTLCRCIADILIPTAGSIHVNGETRAIFNATVGINPQLTGKENAYILARLLFPRLGRDEIKQLVDEAIAFSELGDFIDVPFRNYSKGMQTRICLSVISAAPTDLLILDEVLDGADQFFRAKIAKRMEGIITDSGATIIVSHNSEEIIKHCNRLILLEDSKILFDGSVKKGIAIYNLLKED